MPGRVEVLVRAVTALTLLVTTACGGSSQPAPVTPPQSFDMTGTWSGSFTTTTAGTYQVTMDLSQTNANVTGTFSSSTGGRGVVNGTVAATSLTFTLTSTVPGCGGQLSGTGRITVDGSGVPNASLTFSGNTVCDGIVSGTGNIHRASVTVCSPAVVNVYWETFTDSTGRALNCSDPGSGVAGIQVFVNGQAQFLSGSGVPQPIPCVPFPALSQTEGVGLVDFAPGTYTFDVQAYDVNGRLRYEDQQTLVFPGNACGQVFTVDTVPAATTGTMTMSVTFSGRRTCAPDVNNFFIELVDAHAQPVPNAASVFVPCVDVVGGPPAFQIPDLDFGQTYTFRTLAGTQNDATAPPTNQRTVYQLCGAPVAFSALVQSFTADLLVAASGQHCP